MSGEKDYIRLSAWNVITDVCLEAFKVSTEKIGPVEFEVEVTEDELEEIRVLMIGSKYYQPQPYGRWADKGSALLSEKFGPQDPKARLHLSWAKGERERITGGCRFLTQKDIDEKKALLESLGDTSPSREELFAGIEDCFIWKEVWSRETGHMWEQYSLLRRIPSKEEYDYADCNFYPIRLKTFSTDLIIKMLKDM